MKKFLLTTTALVLLGSHTLFAQSSPKSDPVFAPENNWEIYGGYGYVTLNTFIMLLGYIFAAPTVAIVDELVDQESDLSFSDSGVFNVGVSYYFNDHLYAGVTSTFEFFDFLGHNNVWFASIMPEVGVQYGWSRFKFYHAAAAGLWLVSNTSTFDPSFAFNLTWLGLKFRPTDHLWIYLESNFGQKGLVAAGLRYKL